MSYIEGDAPSLGLDHFVRAYILREELDYSISMLYVRGSKVLRLPGSTLVLYSYHQLTLQLVRMVDVCHSYSRPTHIRRCARIEAA
jgi:hypothetical protein